MKAHGSLGHFLFLQKLSSGLLRDCIEASRPENARKNRYRGMVACKLSMWLIHSDKDIFFTVNVFKNVEYLLGLLRKWGLLIVFKTKIDRQLKMHEI